MKFIDKLLHTSRRNKSLLCIGLDPDPPLMPDVDVLEFNHQIIEATSDLVCAYKPNIAFFEAMGTHGLNVLERTLEYIPDDIPIIVDAKRGDIGNTARKYAQLLFNVLRFDAATVSPYLGHDSVQPFTDYADKGIFILCSTSNSGASDFQQIQCRSGAEEGTMPLFELVARKALEWNVNQNIGLVIGATQPDSLRRARELCPNMPFLIPGIGAQGGNLQSAVHLGTDNNREKAIINASRQVLYASKGNAFPSAARAEALKIRDRINQILIEHQSTND